MTTLTNWPVNGKDQGGSTTTAPAWRRTRRISTAALLGITLVTGTVGGGAIGAGLTARWLVPTAAQGTTITAQPIAQVAQANAASAALQVVGPSVVEVTTGGGAARAGSRPRAPAQVWSSTPAASS